MPDPDVLAAIKRLQRAVGPCRYILHATEEAGLDTGAAERQLKQDRKILHALADAIKAYREAWNYMLAAPRPTRGNRHNAERNRLRRIERVKRQDVVAMKLDDLLALCRGEQPHQPHEENT